MPIIYPTQAIEKVIEIVKEVVKEVIKPVGFAPSIGIGLEMTLEPAPSIPPSIISFPLDIGLRFYSLRLYQYPIGYQLILNPSYPIPPETYLFSLGSIWAGLISHTAINISDLVITAPTIPSVTVISSFSPSAYGEVEMASKPDISTSIVTAPSLPTPTDIRELTVSVGVRLQS